MFEAYLRKQNIIQPENPLTINELKDDFCSLKQIKVLAGRDGISFNVIRNCFGPLSTPLLSIFNSSLQTEIFPAIARVRLVYKTGDENDSGNYKPIPVLSCFSKILERIMHKRLYNHLSENQMLYSKQFGFQGGHSTEHDIMQLIDRINSSFEKKSFYIRRLY